MRVYKTYTCVEANVAQRTSRRNLGAGLLVTFTLALLLGVFTVVTLVPDGHASPVDTVTPVSMLRFQALIKSGVRFTTSLTLTTLAYTRYVLSRPSTGIVSRTHLKTPPRQLRPI